MGDFLNFNSKIQNYQIEGIGLKDKNQKIQLGIIKIFWIFKVGLSKYELILFKFSFENIYLFFFIYVIKF